MSWELSSRISQQKLAVSLTVLEALVELTHAFVKNQANLDYAFLSPFLLRNLLKNWFFGRNSAKENGRWRLWCGTMRSQIRASLTSYAPNAARPPKVTPARRDGTDLSKDKALERTAVEARHLPFLDETHDAPCGDQCSEGISSHVMLFHVTHCGLSEMHQIHF